MKMWIEASVATYPAACLVIACDYNLLLLDSQWQPLQGRGFTLEDAGVETVLCQNGRILKLMHAESKGFCSGHDSYVHSPRTGETRVSRARCRAGEDGRMTTATTTTTRTAAAGSGPRGSRLCLVLSGLVVSCRYGLRGLTKCSTMDSAWRLTRRVGARRAMAMRA